MLHGLAYPTARRLAAVWFADIVGYTSLSSRDGPEAMFLVSTFQDVCSEQVDRYGGRIVKYLGDGALAEFASTDAAVRAALAVEREFSERTSGGSVPGHVRIGVHVGEVVTASDGDIYGDGVNVTSRLQQEAEPGQVLVSEEVWRNLRPDPDYAFRPVGERALRGVQGRMRLFEASLGRPRSGSRSPTSGDGGRSIAVLPFIVISAEHDNEYLGDGIAEELINAFAHVDGLRVVSRTSSFAFRGKEVTVQEIGEKLGVEAVLEGSVRKEGKRLRITPQLVSADGYHLWSDTYEVTLDDVFEVQERISSAIVDSLQVRLASRPEPSLLTRPTGDPEAYRLYLKGKYHWNRHTREDLERSVEYFRRAIEIDPGYALAHAGLAGSFLTLGALFLPPAEAYPRAKVAAVRALEIDEDLAEARAALGEVRMRYDWDWEGAEREFRRALQIDPGHAEASRCYANYLRDMGRIDEAIVVVRRAQELDPESLPIRAAAAGVYFFARRYDEAIEECRRALEMAPFFFQALFYLGSAHERKGEHEKAIAAFGTMVEMARIPGAIVALGHACATAGRVEEAREVLEELLRRSEDEYVPAFFPAGLYVALGEFDAAFEWFDRAVEERCNWMTSIGVDPRFDGIRADRRFRALLERMGLGGGGGEVPGRLPAPVTPIVGRVREIERCVALLDSPEARLLTLVGPGGTGKTRLAIELAGGQRQVRPDGVFFVSLASVRDSALVVPSILRTLNLQEHAHRTVLQALADHLSDKRVLLVLDGFERVLPAAREIAALLRSTGAPRVLATSREPLRIQGEQVFPVPPMGLPSDSWRGEDVGALRECEAVELFVQRARAARPSFELSQDNAEAVVAICRRLDGLPLAIELAAARVRHLSPDAMLSRLDDRFRLLNAGLRDAPEHQRTLRSTFDWSHDLLSAEEQTMFRLLSVFVGGFSLDAAEWIAGGVETDEFHALDGVGSLVDKSFVQEASSPNGEVRFEMLETIREYGLLLLRESGEEEATRLRHTEYFQHLAAEAEPRLEGADQARWFDRLEAEHANVCEALDWLLSHGRVEMAVRLGSALWWFWWVRGHFGEMRWRLEQALARSGELPGPLRANLLVATGALVSVDGDHERAARLFEEAVELERGRSGKTGVPRALRSFAFALGSRGEYARAATLFEEALARDREFGDPHGEAADLRGVGKMEACRGRYAEARRRFEEALSIDRTHGDAHSAAFSLTGLGDVERYEGNPDAAAVLYGEALELCREVGSKPGEAYALHDLADAERDRGRYAEAADGYRRALGLLAELGNRRRIAGCVAGLAALAVAEERYERAARLLGMVERLRASVTSAMPPFEREELERTFERVRDRLGEERHARLVEEGRALDPVRAADPSLLASTV